MYCETLVQVAEYDKGSCALLPLVLDEDCPPNPPPTSPLLYRYLPTSAVNVETEILSGCDQLYTVLVGISVEEVG